MTAIRNFGNGPRPVFSKRKVTRTRRNPRWDENGNSKISNVKRNPIGRFVIVANLGGSAKDYYRHSTRSFVHGQKNATLYKSQRHAVRQAKEILGNLPNEILSVSVGKL